MWETLSRNQAVRVGAAAILALAAVVALVIALASPARLRIPTFDELFPPPAPALSVQQRLEIMRSISSDSYLTAEEKDAILQGLGVTDYVAPAMSSEEKMRILRQTKPQN